jgi:hypothetical protein
MKQRSDPAIQKFDIRDSIYCSKDNQEVDIIKRFSWESNKNCQTMSYGPTLNRCYAEDSGKELHELCSKIKCVKLYAFLAVKWKCCG